MSFSRRTFLIGAGSGLSLLALTACTDGTPVPTNSAVPTTPSTPFPIPQPSAMERSAWASDPFARGSHSFMAVGSTPQHRQALRTPLIDRVFFAGEATSDDHPGTVLGARQSGAMAAAAVSGVTGVGERIAVIGAGAAGAEAARTLKLYGHDVMVIEARDRTGGRILTKASKGWATPVELGAWRLNEKADAALLTELTSLSIATAVVTTPELRSTTTVASAEADKPANIVGNAALATAVAWAQKQQADQSLSDAIVGSGASKTAAASSGAVSDGDPIAGDAMLAARNSSLAAQTGADSVALSGWYGVPDAATADGAEALQRVVTGGFSAVIADALDGVTTSLSTTVVGVSYSDSGVSMRLGTGESLGVDRVIITVPLGVLQSGAMDFSPLLPFEHRTAIDELGFGATEVIWLKFDEPFWATDATVWQVVGTEDLITNWINLEPITGEAVLVGFVGGNGATEFADLSDDALVASALAGLVPFSAN